MPREAQVRQVGIWADIDLQLCKRLISNPAAISLNIYSIIRRAKILGRYNKEDNFIMQSDYVSFLGLDNLQEAFIEWDNFLDADESAEINLF
jgi:hypothetical protein